MRKSFHYLKLLALCVWMTLPQIAMAQSDVGCFVFSKDNSGKPGTFPIGIATAAASGQVKGRWLTNPSGPVYPLSGTYVPAKSFTSNSLRQQTVVATFSYVRTSTECIQQSGPTSSPCWPGVQCNSSCVSAAYSVYEYGSYVTYCNDGAPPGVSGPKVNVACSFEGLDAGSGYLRGALDNNAGSLTGHICAMSTGCLEYTGQLAASYSNQEVSVPVPNGTPIKYTFSEALPDPKGVERVRFFKATNAAFLSPSLFCVLSGGGGGAPGGGGGGAPGGGGGGAPGGGIGGGSGPQNSCAMACSLGSCVGDTGCPGVSTGPDASCTRCVCSSDGQQPACNAGGNTGAGNNGGSSGRSGYVPGSGGSNKSGGSKLGN